MSVGVVRETVLSTLRVALEDARASGDLKLTTLPALVLDVPKKRLGRSRHNRGHEPRRLRASRPPRDRRNNRRPLTLPSRSPGADRRGAPRLYQSDGQARSVVSRPGGDRGAGGAVRTIDARPWKTGPAGVRERQPHGSLARGARTGRGRP